MDFARTFKKAVPHQLVVLTVHDMKRLGRGSAELLSIADDLRTNAIELELLTGPSKGATPSPGTAPPSSCFFTGMAEFEREYSREEFAPA
ncbi:recombinase family protein [Streptomyces sp. NPDC000878]